MDQSIRSRMVAIADLEPQPVQIEHVLAQPRGREALQHKRIARRRLVGDQLVGGLDPELRLRRPCGRTAAQPRQLLAHQVPAASLRPGGQPHPLGAGQHVGGVPAVVRVDGAVVHLPRPGGDRVEEPAVVADHHQRLRPQPGQVAGQPADHLDVEMVGGLVEHQHVVSGEQHRGQRHPASLTAAEVGRRRRRGPPRPADARRRRGCRVRRPRCGPAAAADDDLADGRAGGEVVSLAQIAHRQSRRVGDATRIGLAGAGQNLQQRRLAVAVAPDDADRVAFVDAQAHGVQQGAGAVADGRAFDVDQVRHQPPMIGGHLAEAPRALCHDDLGNRGTGVTKGEPPVVDLSAITRPVGRLVATAQNGLEVLRYGGLETGAVPSPFQIVESVPMYRLRRYFPPDTRPGAKPPGPPVLMVHPMMMSADMWDVTRDDGAVGILHNAGIDPWVIDFGEPDKVEGGMQRNLADHVVALSEAIDTVKETTGRDVHLAGYSQGGMFCYQTAAYRRSKDLASIIAFGAPVDTLAALPMNLPAGLAAGAADFMADHVFSRIDIPGWLARTGFQMLDPIKTAQSRAGLPAPAARPRGAAAARAAAAFPGVGGLDRLVGSGDLRTAQAVHRAQPDDDRRLLHPRRPGDAQRHRLPGAGGRRRGRRHRPAGLGARHQAGRPAGRCVRIPHPHRPFRLGRRIEGGHPDLADRRPVGQVARR